MRHDTRLVLVDIPGVNEAGSSKVYMDYATENWDSFDLVVVVLDARQGANTDDQVNLAFEVS
jgi:GTPase Era involved in 16S rRNA processing